MATSVLFVGWGQPIPGREQKALQVFNEALQYWTRLQKQGVIDSFEPVNLELHGGDLTGFTLLRGDAAKLAQLRRDPEFTNMSVRAELVVSHFGVVAGSTGEQLEKEFRDFGKNAAELA